MLVVLEIGSRIVCLYFFFFQAEGGIRDPFWSRGGGDVYKGPCFDRSGNSIPALVVKSFPADFFLSSADLTSNYTSVSYTLLPLPPNKKVIIRSSAAPFKKKTINYLLYTPHITH